MVNRRSVASLHNMSSGNTTFCENTGRLCSLPERVVHGSSHVLQNYPEVHINCDIFNSSSFQLNPGGMIDSHRNFMVPVNEGVFKRITRAFFQDGFAEALNEARHPATAAFFPLIASAAESTYQLLDYIAKLKVRIFPHMREKGMASIAQYSETRDWIRSKIRCVAWHPNCFKIAVAGCDDVIRIHTDEQTAVPLLKNFNQKWVTSMAWRPHSAAELAVGCQKGICLWTVDTNTHIIRSSHATLLKHPNHCPVTAVQWNVDGTLLASCSINDISVIIWHIDKMQPFPLKRLGSPCSLLKWSPDGLSIFSSTISNVFRVWSTETDWVSERWTVAYGTIQSACWSPCGCFLLFVTSEDTLLYSLNVIEEIIVTSNYETNQAVPIVELCEKVIDEQKVGGLPQALAWDPNGLYLAITFKDSPCIAIFSTCVQKICLTIEPLCLVIGSCGEYPSYICFQSKIRENPDSVLTIAWSSGRLEYYPINT